ncbi:MAG: trypsin-like peptidase domain-containing protein [Bryobacteraceae bacterium]
MPFPVPGRIAEQLRQSTVQIRSGRGRAEGSGSGFVLNAGRIVTNAHVIAASETNGGGTLSIESWDGQTRPARVLKIDGRRDLALITVEGGSETPGTLASQPAEPGQPVIAVGNPMGFVGAISSGVVHRVGAIRGLGPTLWIQADLRLAPGNSGGPLADLHGEVVGINSMIAGGLALAIPAQAVQRFVESGGHSRSLGVVVRPVAFTSQRNGRRPGLLILELIPNGPAERASLLPGDLIIGVNGKPLTDPDELLAAIETNAILPLEFHRGDTTRVRRVTVQLADGRVVNAE